jgi:prepilin-type N-terminal cleavage/methylation domain-containing protein
MSKEVFSGDESGFTLQELLVVMAASAIMFSLSMSLYGFVTRLVAKAAREDELREVVEQTLRHVVADIERGKEITVQNDSTIDITRSDGRLVRYASAGGILLRNEDTLSRQGGVSMWLRSKMASEKEKGSTSPFRFDIELVGRSRTSVYSTLGRATLPWSSTASLHETSRHDSPGKSTTYGLRP